jgi:CrcB protein
MIYLYIALGGAVGSLLRYSLGGAVQRVSASGFPIGTLFVNVSGCFIIGVLVRQFMNMQLSPELRALLIVGFCGGFTTFSTFANENMNLLRNGDYFYFTLYLVLSIVLGIAAVVLGNSVVNV